MKILSVILVLVISAACAAPAVAQQAKTRQDKSVVSVLLDDWVLYPNSEISSTVLQCASRSRREWKVESEENRIKISLDQRQNHQAVLPAALRSQNAEFGLKGSRSVQQIAGG
jgi:hypothetical protein